MATIYVDIGGSRIASYDGVDQSDADDADVTGWYRDIDIMFCHTIYTSKGPLDRQFKLQYENTTDNPGTWNDIGNGSGDIRFDGADTVIPSDDYTITSGYRICSTVAGYSWQNGVANKEDNTILDSGAYTLNDEYYTEFQWALNIGNTTLGKQYSFRLYDVTMGYAHAAFGAQLTINTSDIESTGVRLFGEETSGSPDYRYDWTGWVNYPAGTAPTINNGDYGQIEGGTVASPVMRVGGADFIRILDNFYGSTTSGTYKIYYRAYPSIFPWNTNDSVIQWQEYQKTAQYPQGHIDRTTENFYQIKLEESTSAGTGIGNQASRMACAQNPLGSYPYVISCGINGSGLGLVAGFSNYSGGFGLGGTYYSYTFRSLTAPGGRTWTYVHGGGLTTGWIDTAGFLWVGGSNTWGFLGQGHTDTISTSLCSVLNNGNFIQVDIGSYAVMGLKSDGSAYVWGNEYMIGDGRVYGTGVVSTPTSVAGGHSFVSLWSSGQTCHAIDGSGQIWSWGMNTDLQCGCGGPYGSPTYVSYYSTPVTPNYARSVSKEIYRATFTYFMDDYGHVYRLGYDKDSYKTSPTELGGLYYWCNIQDIGFDPSSIVSVKWLPIYGDGIIKMGNGGLHDTSGVIWRWGYAADGRLGRNYCHQSTTIASPILGGSVWRAYWDFAGTCFALRDDNVMFGWGNNYYYAIGDGTTYDRYSPSQTGGLQGWS